MKYIAVILLVIAGLLCTVVVYHLNDDYYWVNKTWADGNVIGQTRVATYSNPEGDTIYVCEKLKTVRISVLTKYLKQIAWVPVSKNFSSIDEADAFLISFDSLDEKAQTSKTLDEYDRRGDEFRHVDHYYRALRLSLD